MNSGPNVPKWPVCSRQPCLSWLDPAAATHAADSPAGHGSNQQQRGWWQLFGSSSNCHSGSSVAMASSQQHIQGATKQAVFPRFIAAEVLLRGLVTMRCMSEW